MQPEIKDIAKRLNQEVAVCARQFGWSKRVARLTYLKNIRRLVSELYVRDNCHPFKATVLVWVQLPMWVFISVALRNLSTGATHSDVCVSTVSAGTSIQDQLAAGGTLWFPDLTAVDSTWILPVSVGVVNLLIVEIFALQKNREVTFSNVCYEFCSSRLGVDGPSGCHSTLGACSLLAVLQPHGPLSEPSAALPWLPTAVPDTTEQVRLGDPVQRPLCCLLRQVPFKKTMSPLPVP